MSTTNQRRSSKERFWRRMVRQWRNRRLSVRDFCAEEQLSEPSFYAWRRTLGQRDTQASQFVPVKVVPDDKTGPGPDARAAGLELVLGGGRRLRIGPGFDASTLQRLLALLEESRP
jgi:hypothetical protein